MENFTESKLRIIEYCRIIRSAIVCLKDKTRLFKDFPNGCCRDTSLIVGELLKEKGFENIIYCSKDIDSDFSSHAWIEYKKHIIDLTADQFGDEFNSVMMLRVKKGDKLYSHSRKESCSFNIAEGDLINIMFDYKLILEELKNYSF